MKHNYSILIQDNCVHLVRNKASNIYKIRIYNYGTYVSVAYANTVAGNYLLYNHVLHPRYSSLIWACTNRRFTSTNLLLLALLNESPTLRTTVLHCFHSIQKKKSCS